MPVHITARAVGASPNLRSERIFKAILAVLAKSSEKLFGLLHFSVQGNHVHLIVEADNDVALARGVQRLLSRIAMVVNATARRSGKLWRDRHHRHPLRTPSEMRNAYVYVLKKASYCVTSLRARNDEGELVAGWYATAVAAGTWLLRQALERLRTEQLVFGEYPRAVGDGP